MGSDGLFARRLIAILIALQLVAALTPLIFYDLQVYHLLAPAEFCEPAPDPYSVERPDEQPLAIQLTVGMSLALDASGQLAKMSVRPTRHLLCAGVFELIRPAGRRGPCSRLCLYCIRILEQQTLGVVDLSIAAFLIFGAIWLRQGLRDSQWRPVILSGIAFGLALGSRYQAVILTAIIVVLVLTEYLIQMRQNPQPRRALLQLILVGLIVMVWSLASLIRTMLMGSPVYPLMQGIWKAIEWSPIQDSQFRSETLGPQLGEITAAQKILAPVAMLFAFPSNFVLGTILLLGALAALTSRKRELQITAAIGLAGTIVWGLIRPTAGTALVRYNAVSIVLLLAATGAVLGSGMFFAKFGPGIAAMLAAASVMLAITQLQRFLPVAQSLMDPQVRQTLQELNVPSWAAFDYANEHLDPLHDRILVLGKLEECGCTFPIFTVCL
jgi:hypothetical protein